MFVHGSALKEKLTERAVLFFCNELNVEPDVIDVYYLDQLTKQDALGMCFYLGKKNFSIFVLDEGKDRNITDVFLTIAHEVVHIKHYLHDNLTQTKTPDVPYEDRWYEKEALRIQGSLVKAFVHHLEIGALPKAA